MNKIKKKYRQNKEYVEFIKTTTSNIDDITEKLNALKKEENEELTKFDNINNLLKKKVYYFNTVQDMKNNLILMEGDMLITKGYYSINDGGGGKYIVANEGVDDDKFIIGLSNNLKAHLMIENSMVNIRQLGARTKSENLDYDIKPYIESYISKLDEIPELKLYIPKGIWNCSALQINRKDGFSIYGDEGFISADAIDTTFIAAMGNAQEYIWLVGGSTQLCSNINIKNITFSGDKLIWDTTKNRFKLSYNCYTLIQGALIFRNCQFMNVDNLFFKCIVSTNFIFKIISCWEINFGYLNFRATSAYNGGCLNFGENDTTVLATANISALKFDYLMFEGIHGDCIKYDYHTNVVNSHINVINFEDYKFVTNGEVYTNFDNEHGFDENSGEHNSIIYFSRGSKCCGCVIDSIELNNFAFRKNTYNSKEYTYDAVVKFGNYASTTVVINNIAIHGQSKDGYLILQDNDSTVYKNTQLTINNYISIDNYRNICKVNNFPMLNINCDLNLQNECKNILSGTFTPILNNITMNYDQDDGFITYDEDSFNNKKLCIKPRLVSGNRVFANFISVGSKFYLIAKIPNNETIKFTLREVGTTTTNFSVIECAGNGSFKIYSADINFEIGTKLEILVSYSNTTIIPLVDSFKFM